MRRMFSLVAVLLLVALVSACGAQQPAAEPPPAPQDAPVDPTEPAPPTPEQPAEEAPAATLSGELLVFAAASLTDAFTEIGETFEEQNPGTRISFNFAGSQQLAQQIGQGAPADVFASANNRQLEVVIEEGRIEGGTQQTFVRNRLVVVYPADNPAGLDSLADLANPGVRLILAAPEVPIGGYSQEFLARASELPEYTEAYSPTVLANVVSYEENVRSVLTKVALGEGDAGIVYTSDILPAEANQVGRIEIPDELNTIAEYPIAVITDAPNAALAQAFVDYILSDEAQAILEQYGFIPITQN